MAGKQQGYVFLLFVVALSIIASLWLSSQQRWLVSQFKNQERQRDFTELKLVKERLLEFAVLQPEIYQTTSVGVYQEAYQIPSPGYFPCPDLDGDGDLTGSETSCFNTFVSGTPGTGYVPDPALSSGLGSCDGTGVCVGFVPQGISTRNIYFAEAGRYYLFVDERFVNQNPSYTNGGQLRFAPLNPIEFDTKDGNVSNDPVLSLNGVTGYIALIVDAGSDGLDAENIDGDADFISGTDDLADSDTHDSIVGISYNEWLGLVAHRVCAEKGRFDGTDVTFTEVGKDDAHWFNDYDSTENPGGGTWRTWSVVCP